MPAFLHFYSAYTDATYRRIPCRKWMAMIEYMSQTMKAASGH